MRPKKRILLYVGSAVSLSHWTYVLQIRGYEVLACDGPAEAGAMVSTMRERIDGCLVVRVEALDGCIDALRLIEQTWDRVCFGRELPLLVLDRHKTLANRSVSLRAMYFHGEISCMDILERLRIAIMRKRGPKRVRPVSLGQAS
jgi:hypothetical protein